MCSTFLVSSVQATLYEDAEQYGVQNNIQKPNRTADGWYVYDYNPVADAGGYDSAVTHVKYQFNDKFLGSCGVDRSVELKMRMGVK